VILVDTNVLVAAARTADSHHVAAARLLLRETDDRFLVAPTVLAQTCCLLHEFGSPAPEVAFLRSIAAGELERAVLTVADVVRMAELAERYADLGLGGTWAVPGPGAAPGPIAHDLPGRANVGYVKHLTKPRGLPRTFGACAAAAAKPGALPSDTAASLHRSRQ